MPLFLDLWKGFKKVPVPAKAGVFLIAFYTLASLLAPALSPFEETALAGDVWEVAFWTNDCSVEGIEAYQCWDELNKDRETKLWLGTDHLGRDLLTRLLYGGRNTISIALVTTLLSFTIGVTLGFLAATTGNIADQLLSRSVDILMAFPTLIFALIVLSVVGTSTITLILTIAILDATRVFRLSRAVAMDVAVMEFVEVARLRGEGLWWVMRHEILPNTLAPLVAEFGLRFCFVFLFIASLSFLGLGIQPPYADWGGMVRENAGAITFGIYTPLMPAAAIALLTISVNLIVDWFLQKTAGLRDEY
jgi:peptide/nickel transport system permease protein